MGPEKVDFKTPLKKCSHEGGVVTGLFWRLNDMESTTHSHFEICGFHKWNHIFGTFEIFENVQKWPILADFGDFLKNPRNSRNLRFSQFWDLRIWKIEISGKIWKCPKLKKSWISQNLENLRFGRFLNFKILKIVDFWKCRNIWKCQNLKKSWFRQNL